MTTSCSLIAVVALLTSLARPQPDPISRFDVVWTSPSRDSSGSMPLGNGDIGANLWVEEGGDLLFYISKTDAWDENGRLLKLGRVRVHLDPNPFAAGASFRQALVLRRGEVQIAAGDVRIRAWVDANRPVMRVEVQSHTPVRVEARLETWRDVPRTLTGRELDSAYGQSGSPQPVVESADKVLPERSSRIVWFHRNPCSVWQSTLRLQGLGDWARDHPDPILHRTFGGALAGEGMTAAGPTALRTPQPVKRATVSVYALTLQHATPAAWRAALDRLIREAGRVPLAEAWAAHRRWWSRFWNRSWINVTGAGTGPEIVSRGYTLQRYVTACAGRGGSPLKFNGSIFTVDAREPNETFDADYRRWGGLYWFQNTRLAYWPMLASGDEEMLAPLFRMYLDALPFARYRTERYFGHAGAFFPETMYFWGAYANDNYGWDRKGKAPSFVDNTYIRWYWSDALELTCLMLERYKARDDAAFLHETLLPFAVEILRFYDQHYHRTPEGKLLIQPAQALETWQNVIDPAPEIAGLRAVLDGLLALGPRRIGSQNAAAWQRLRAKIPDLPQRDTPAGPVLAPAREILARAANSENPELYAVFPYRLFGADRPGLDLARRTYAAREFKGHVGWRQDEIQAACLGLAHEAADGLVQRFSSKHADSRFPAFWGPNFDWIPDQDHGSAGMLALQTMLLQSAGDRILLFPAWPREWDVSFRLHAPRNTVVQGVLRAGRLERLDVTPASRRKDVVVLPPQ